ncbi:serine/threonine-protein kinase [Streptomyces sp. NPDC001193]
MSSGFCSVTRTIQVPLSRPGGSSGRPLGGSRTYPGSITVPVPCGRALPTSCVRRPSPGRRTEPSASGGGSRMPVRTVPVSGEQPACGTLLAGRYRLQVPIGSGGTADVFRGTDEVLGREVAVKVFRAGSDTATPDSFCDEARTLARLSHRALVTIYDFDAGRQGQGPFMVTELIRGATLRARIAAGPLSAPHVTRLGAEIASALDHVHSRGIVHHDVKPSNVLLNEAGSPHLADFGLSRMVHDRSLESSETLVGTLAYMAPEQFLGEPASTASDIYALGLTLLEALTGHREYA